MTSERSDLDILCNLREIVDEVEEVDEPSEYLSEIDIACIVEQFINTETDDDSISLEERVQFMELASELLSKKASAFVRDDEEQISEEDMDDEDQSERLLASLMEYRRYQMVAEELNRKAEDMQKRHSRIPPEIVEWEEALADVEGAELTDLVTALDQLLTEEIDDDVQTIERESISVEDCMSNIREQLVRGNGSLQFSEIFPTHRGRTVVVVTFVALLELIRRREVKVSQSERFGPILLYSTQHNEIEGE